MADVVLHIHACPKSMSFEFEDTDARSIIVFPVPYFQIVRCTHVLYFEKLLLERPCTLLFPDHIIHGHGLGKGVDFDIFIQMTGITKTRGRNLVQI